MGIYDRDYNRAPYGDGDRIGLNLAGPLSLTTKLVIVMFGMYFVQLLTRPSVPRYPGDDGWFTNTLALHADWLRRPWLAFELLTYSFLHSPFDIKHILFNMLGLWLFGREVEARYGPREYLTFFFSAVVFAGLFWTLGEVVADPDKLATNMSLGASGGIAAIVILYAFNWPHRTVLFMFFIPMPMWILGLILVGMDTVGAIQRTDNVAFTAHLGGALFAALYYKRNWRLAAWLPGHWRLPKLGSRPKLRVHRPEDLDESAADDSSAVDDILRKIAAQGLDSLTRRERQILEEQSREEQRKRRGP